MHGGDCYRWRSSATLDALDERLNDLAHDLFAAQCCPLHTKVSAS